MYLLGATNWAVIYFVGKTQAFRLLLDLLLDLVHLVDSELRVEGNLINKE